MIKAKNPIFFPLMREKRAEIRSRKLNEKCGERDSLKDEHMFMKGVIPWYAVILWYGMVWSVRFAMRFQYYALVYFLQNTHSATVTFSCFVATCYMYYFNYSAYMYIKLLYGTIY